MADKPSFNIIYRGIQAQDRPRLVQIYNHAVQHTTATFDLEEQSESFFDPWLPGDAQHRMLIAEVNGEIAAYAGCSAFKRRKAYDQCAETMIYVHPDWQGKGIGRALFQRMHQDGFFDGLHTLLSLSNKSNIGARKLFEEVGYVQKGEMADVGLKFGERHSVVVYQRDVKV